MSNRRFITLICFVSFVMMGIAGAMLGPTLQQFADSLSLPLANAEILRVVRQAGTFVSILIGGRLLDRYNTRSVMAPGVFLIALGLVGSVLGNLPIALAAALLIGMGTAVVDVGSNFVIGSLFGAGASSVLTALHTFYGVGISVGPQVANWGIQRGDWRFAYLVTAAACVVVGITYVIIKFPSAHPLPSPLATEGTSPSPSLLRTIRWLPLLPLITLIFLYSGAGTGISDLLPTHLLHALSTTPDVAARVTTIYGIALTSGRLFSVWTLRRFGNLRVITVGVGLATLGACLVFFSGQVEVVTVGILFLGIGFAPIYPVVIAVGGHGQPELRGTIIGILSGTATLGGLILPYLQGLVGGGQSGGMIVTLAATLLMAIAIFSINVGTRRRAVPISAA